MLAAVAALASPASAWAAAADTYYERAFVMAADDRCDLFEPRLGAALGAATAQARGAALRAGVLADDLNARAHRARARAAATPCDSRDLAVVRGRVDHAFAGWSRTPRMTFAGTRSQWVADRMRREAPHWRLIQTSRVGASPVSLGYGEDAGDGALTAVVSFVGSPRPYAARLVTRDVLASPRPWLSDGLPPASVRASDWAGRVEAAPASLLSEGRKQGEAWRFPASAARRLEALDPRETFAVEFHFRDGTVATARFEAGDFTAGKAFLAMGMI